MNSKAGVRRKYIYKGPVFLGDKFVTMTSIELWANSPSKAYSDIISQIRSQLKLDTVICPDIRISYNLIKKEELKYGKTV